MNRNLDKISPYIVSDREYTSDMIYLDWNEGYKLSDSIIDSITTELHSTKWNQYPDLSSRDLLDRLSEYTNTDKEFIIGKGYSDSRIINNSVKRTYNTENINSVIKKNPNVQLYSTWGKGSNLTSWKKELNKLPTITKLVSPSRVARVPKGENKENFVLNNWKKNIL